MIDVGQQPSATKTRNKLTILLMDGSSERRALRKRIVALHGVEVVGACYSTEAASIWRRDPCNALAPVELVRPQGLPQCRALWSNRKNTGALQYEYRKESETAHD
jgi:hypothetical protein